MVVDLEPEFLVVFGFQVRYIRVVLGQFLLIMSGLFLQSRDGLLQPRLVPVCTVLGGPQNLHVVFEIDLFHDPRVAAGNRRQHFRRHGLAVFVPHVADVRVAATEYIVPEPRLAGNHVPEQLIQRSLGDIAMDANRISEFVVLVAVPPCAPVALLHCRRHPRHVQMMQCHQLGLYVGARA